MDVRNRAEKFDSRKTVTSSVAGLQISNLTPCASGSFGPYLIVFVPRRMYAFQESEPASRPPPVSCSPPNAPPISAPDGPMLTLAIPQSEPLAEMNRSDSRTSLVKIDDDRPWG